MKSLGDYVELTFDELQRRLNNLIKKKIWQSDASAEDLQRLMQEVGLEKDLVVFSSGSKDYLWDTSDLEKLSLPLNLSLSEVVCFDFEIPPEDKIYWKGEMLKTKFSFGGKGLTEEERLRLYIYNRFCDEINRIARERNN